MSEAAHYSFTLALTLQAPFLIAGSQPLHYGVDVAQIRNADGKPIIPDTHIKGVLRHAWALFEAEGIGLSQTTDRLFGRMPPEVFDDEAENGDTPRFDDEAGSLVFYDLEADCDASAASVTRVAIKDSTGAASEGALVTVEEVAEVGELVAFTGKFIAFCDTKDEAVALGQDVELALRAVEAIGRFKTVGFGHIESFAVGAPQTEASAGLPAGAKETTEFELAFRLDKRLLVDIRRLDRNTLEGADIIPGTVMKGALARSLARLGIDPRSGELGAALSRMIFSQALPFESPANPGDSALAGAVNLNAIRIANQAEGHWPPTEPLAFNKSGELAAFAPDWKDFEPDPKKPNLRRDVRTRVAIDAARGAAKEGALFTQAAIAREAWIAAESKTVPIEWRCSVRWPGEAGDAGHREFLDCMEVLSRGLHSLGKTNARTVDLRLAVAKTDAKARFASAIRYVVTLTSPTLMIRERHLASEKLYQQALDTYWCKVSGGCLEIATENESGIFGSEATCSKPLDFYCHQEFRSSYAALRFAFFGRDRLEPFVLSKPGSVFVLTATDSAKAFAILESLRRTGLPAAVWSDDVTGLGTLDLTSPPNFESCPFIPQNGYGAFSLADEETGK